MPKAFFPPFPPRPPKVYNTNPRTLSMYTGELRGLPVVGYMEVNLLHKRGAEEGDAVRRSSPASNLRPLLYIDHRLS